MAQIIQRASDVRINEINLSNVLTNTASTSVAALAIISKRGSTKPKRFSNADDFLFEYGNPEPGVNPSIQSALNFFSEGSDLWAVRAVNNDTDVKVVKPKISCLILLTLPNSNSKILYPVGLTESQLTLSTEQLVTDLKLGTGTKIYALFYNSRGPGSYGDDYAISVRPVTPPILGLQLSPNPSTASKFFTQGTYFYQANATNNYGENPSPIVSYVVSTANVSSISGTISIPENSAPINSINVYRSSASKIGTLAESATAITDESTIQIVSNGSAFLYSGNSVTGTSPNVTTTTNLYGSSDGSSWSSSTPITTSGPYEITFAGTDFCAVQKVTTGTSINTYFPTVSGNTVTIPSALSISGGTSFGFIDISGYGSNTDTSNTFALLVSDTTTTPAKPATQTTPATPAVVVVNYKYFTSTSATRTWSNASTILSSASFIPVSICTNNGNIVVLSTGQLQLVGSGVSVTRNLPSALSVKDATEVQNRIFIAGKDSKQFFGVYNGNVAVTNDIGQTWVIPKLNITPNSAYLMNGEFVVMDSTGNFQTSTDGVKWSLVKTSPQLKGLSQTDLNLGKNSLASIKSPNNVFVFAPKNGTSIPAKNESVITILTDNTSNDGLGLYKIPVSIDASNVFIDNSYSADLPVVPPASSLTPSKEFAVNFYYVTNGVTSTLEEWKCTFDQFVGSDGSQEELESKINSFSSFFNVKNFVTASTLNQYVTNGTPVVSAIGGDSGSAPTSTDVISALSVFSDRQLYPITILFDGGAAPDPVTQRFMDKLVSDRGDAVAFFNVPSGKQDYRAAINYRNNELSLNSTYSALFCPDQKIADVINGQQTWSPLASFAAALCARTDKIADPSKAIAGLNRGVIGQSLKSRYSYNDSEASALFVAGVNYTRTFAGIGTALWEQKTLATQQSALSWISVRRMVNVIKSSMYSFLLYAIQENNTDTLRRQIKNSLDAYLGQAKSAEAISNFSVSIPDDNISAKVAGILIVNVVIVPSIPVHEVQVSIAISKSGVNFEELINRNPTIV